MQHKYRRLTENFWVAPQLEPSDFADIAALGIRTVVNNRPDGEAAGQPRHEELEAAARAAGLILVHVPVVSGAIFPDQVAAMNEALATNPGPWLAFCRSGSRSCHLWALMMARRLEPARIVEQAWQAGYDLTALWPALEAIHAAFRDSAPVA